MLSLTRPHSVQFFNNPLCNVASSGFAASFQYWTQAAAANPNGGTKLLIGVPGESLYIRTVEFLVLMEYDRR